MLRQLSSLTAGSASSSASDAVGGKSAADGAMASPTGGVASASGAKVSTSKMISQGHDNFDLIFMMLMGIRTAVGKFANVPSRDLTAGDFDQKWDGDFLHGGSADTPAHSHHDFRFRDYSPLVFRQIRERFGVMTPDYLLSLTSEYVLVEMFTNSKSGSFFFYSSDYRFILKTCTKREAGFLMSALPQYHAHLSAHRYTLLCRFFGLHRVRLPGNLGRTVYFVVMGNVFPIDKPIHERYDLKGSTRGRATSEAEKEEPNVVLKDLDWIRAGRKLHLGADKKRRLLAQIKKDCALLERLEVIDYSLLVGIHRASASRQDVASREREASRFYKVRRASADGGDDDGGGGAAAAAAGRAAVASAGNVDAPSGGGGGERAAESGGGGGGGVQIVDTISQQQLQRDYQRRTGAATTAGGDGGGGGGGGGSMRQPDAPEIGKEVYFVGCIDILCEYGLKKQLEHHYKAAKHGEKVGAQNFSVVDPLQYSTRFQNFVSEALD